MQPPDGVSQSVWNLTTNLRHAVSHCSIEKLSQSKKPQILMDGNERPGDVVASGIGRGGSDLVIDLCCVDPHSQCSNAKRRKRARVVGATASDAEKAKRNKRGGPHNWRMEDRVAAQGMEFLALGMEISAATTSTCANFLKKLSEIAHRRRGHNKSVFKRRWTIDWGMLIAKRGASVALSRIITVIGERKGFLGGSIVPMFSADAEPLLLEAGGG